MCLWTPLTEEITAVKSLCKYRTWMCHCLKWSQRYWLSQVSYNGSCTVMLVVVLTFSGHQWLTPATIAFKLVYIFKLHSYNYVRLYGSNVYVFKFPGQASFQLKFGPVQYCIYWSVSQHRMLHSFISTDILFYPPNVHRKPQQMKLTLPSGKLFKMPSMTAAAVDSKWKLYSIESSAVEPWRSMQFTGAALMERVTNTQLLSC